MDQMEEKLGTILNNPQMMQQIMSMAQSLGQPAPATKQENAQEVSSPLPEIDLSLLSKLSGFAQNSGIDKQQRALLSALSPYLSRDRVSKLEKAMRAAKLAKFASTFLGSGGLQLLSGR
jgi:hypothetical protein